MPTAPHRFTHRATGIQTQQIKQECATYAWRLKRSFPKRPDWLECTDSWSISQIRKGSEFPCRFNLSCSQSPPNTQKKKIQKNQYKITFSAITVSRALICHIAMASTLHPILYFPLYFRYISPASTEILCTRLWIPATVRSVVPVLLAPLPGGGEFIVIINSLPGTCKYETLHAGARLIQAVRFYWTMAGRTRASISLARHYQNY